MKDGNTQNLAEKIARLLREEKTESDDFAALRAGLEKINERLDAIEGRLTAHETGAVRSPAVAAHSAPHASQDRFTNLEELADEIINHLPNEKACPYEPTGKPCDHCSMCSSRGF